MASKPSFTYLCYPFSHLNKYHCEDGNKIIMPASALDVLLSVKNIIYPMTFMITNPFLAKVSHCGVLEFSGEEGYVYVPRGMMNDLALQQGQLVNIEYTGLLKGKFLKIQPHSTEFIKNLSNPKEVMERILKDFACVTVGDTITVNHENRSHCIDIVAAMPRNAVSLFETDCELEFEKPLDYKEPEKIELEDDDQVKDAANLEKDAGFKPFTGVSRRLDGRVSAPAVVAAEDDKKLVVDSRKRARTVVCGSDGSDGNCSAAKKVKTEDGIEGVKEERKDNIAEKKFEPFTGKKYTLLSCW